MGKLIGFIGQGWIGKSYADNFETRGYQVVRYAKEEPYSVNQAKISKCDIVFIAVPTPTTSAGFDDSILRQVIKLVGEKKIAVIKSTIMPGTTESIQKDNPNIYVVHSPEFLTEATSAYDAANPQRNIIGIPLNNDEYKQKAKQVMEVLPFASYQLVCRAKEAELTKYGGNCWFYFKVVFINLLYDLAGKLGVDYQVVKEAMSADPRIGSTHLDPIHKTGRGAGGHCFIKDFAVFSKMYRELVGNELGLKVLAGLKDKNIDLLVQSNKDLDLLKGVYGEDFINKKIKKK